MFSPLLERWFRSRAHEGPLEEATHYGQGGEPGQGPYVRLWLRVEEGVVKSARWRTYGCPVMVGCAEAFCTVAEGRPRAVLAKLDVGDAARLVGGVPEGKEHCPQLVVSALESMATQ